MLCITFDRIKEFKSCAKSYACQQFTEILEKLTHIIVLLFCAHSFDKAFHYKETPALNSIIGRQLIIISHISLGEKVNFPSLIAMLTKILPLKSVLNWREILF